jgi:hypothetical protein
MKVFTNVYGSDIVEKYGDTTYTILKDQQVVLEDKLALWLATEYSKRSFLERTGNVPSAPQIEKDRLNYLPESGFTVTPPVSAPAPVPAPVSEAEAPIISQSFDSTVPAPVSEAEAPASEEVVAPEFN